MDFKFLFYVFISIVFILGGTYNFFKTGKEVAAGIFFIGALSASLYFGLRWFTPAGDLKTPGGPTKWPPAINYCPDFMILDLSGNTEPVCIDTIGVSKSQQITVTTASTTRPLNAANKFGLRLKETGEGRAKNLCEDCRTKGVTWEGVWNGFVCMNNDPPRPPGA